MSAAPATAVATPENDTTGRFTPRSQRRARIVAVATLVLLAAAPWMLDAYAVSTVSKILVMGLVAMSATLLTGVTGLPTLGQAAYFGIGAYTAALLALSGMTVGVVHLAAAAALATAVAAVTGPFLVRTRGITFLMLTLAVGELVHTLAIQWRSLTGSSDGLYGVPAVRPLWGMAPLELDGFRYYYILVCFVPLYLLVRLVVRSPFGLALRGIRDNEARMRATGYPVERYMFSAHCAAGALAGAAGALWVVVQQYVSPGDLAFDVSAMALLAAVIGGLGSLWGACLGAALVVGVRTYLGGEFVGKGELLLGVLFVIVVYLLPQGVSGIAFRRVKVLWARVTRRSGGAR